MALTDAVTVSIGSTPAAVTEQGFGIPLILSGDTHQPGRVSFYTDTAGMVTDGYATTDAAYIAAAAIFAQNPRPQQIAVGRMVNKPTAVFTVAPAAVKNTTAYQMHVGGQAALYTSDGSATNDEIVAGLVTAINALSGAGATAAATGSVGSQVVTLTATAAGAFVAVYVDDKSLLTITQTHADPGVTAELDAIFAVDNTWYGVINPWNSKAMALAIAAWCETNKRLFVSVSLDGDTLTNAGGNVFAALKAANYAHTVPAYHGRNGECMAAAWMGLMFAKDPGSATWANKQLIGVSPSTLTASQIAALKTNFAGWYYAIGGRNRTSPDSGHVADGEWADVIVGEDWLIARMQERIFGKLSSVDKVAFTNDGIHTIDAEMRAQLREAVEQGVLVDNGNLRTVVPDAADVSSSDRNTRTLNGLKFYGDLAGAIHHVAIAGTVTA